MVANLLVDAFAAFDAGRYSQALSMFLSLADNNELVLDERVSVYNYIGYIYQMGFTGSVDYYKSVIWYKRAAELNDSNAQFSLAELLRKNFGDNEKAMAWYLKAADKKYSPALYQLGLAYSVGDIAKKDIYKGDRYLHEAAKLGHYMSRAVIARDLLRGKRGITGIFHGLFELFYLPISAYLTKRKNPLDDRLR